MRTDVVARSVLIQRDFDAYGNIIAEAEIDAGKPLRLQLEQTTEWPDEWGLLRHQPVSVLRPLTVTLPRTFVTKATIRWCVCCGDREIACAVHGL